MGPVEEFVEIWGDKVGFIVEGFWGGHHFVDEIKSSTVRRASWG